MSDILKKKAGQTTVSPIVVSNYSKCVVTVSYSLFWTGTFYGLVHLPTFNI